MPSWLLYSVVPGNKKVALSGLIKWVLLRLSMLDSVFDSTSSRAVHNISQGIGRFKHQRAYQAVQEYQVVQTVGNIDTLFVI